jgi:hypothetical protein
MLEQNALTHWRIPADFSPLAAYAGATVPRWHTPTTYSDLALVATHLWNAVCSVAHDDPSAFYWLFYVGFILLIGGLGAFLATLVSFGGVERNGAAQVALSAYLFLVGAVFLLAPSVWSATGQGEADLGISLVGMAVEVVPVLLITGYQLVPAKTQSPWPPLLTLAVAAGVAVAISLVYVIVGFSVAFLFLSGLPSLASALAWLPLLIPALLIVSVLAVEPQRARRAMTYLRATGLAVLGGTALVALALFLRGPGDWSQPPLWGGDLLLLSVFAGIGVFFYGRRVSASGDRFTPTTVGAISFPRAWARYAAHPPLRGVAAGLIRRVGRMAGRAATRARARRPSIPAWLRRVASGARR